MKNYNLAYHNYLKQITLKGRLYRRFFLYPKFNKFFKGKLLDIGCGLGNLLKFYDNSVGVDINEYNINYCKKNNLQVFKIENDHLPFLDNDFDSVIMDNVLEHIESPDKLIIQIKKILSKDGILIIGVPGIKGFKKDPDHKTFYDIRLLENYLAKFDFYCSKYFYAPFNFEYFSKYLNQHCLYAIFKNKIV